MAETLRASLSAGQPLGAALKRYDLEWRSCMGGYSGSNEMVESSDGEWLRYDDAITMERKCQELEREYAGLCDRYDKLTEALGAQCAESTKLEREVERLRVDANRYRWLRDKAGNVDGESPLVCVVDNEGYQVDGQILVGAELDTVLDAALAEACGRKG